MGNMNIPNLTQEEHQMLKNVAQIMRHFSEKHGAVKIQTGMVSRGITDPKEPFPEVVTGAADEIGVEAQVYVKAYSSGEE